MNLPFTTEQFLEVFKKYNTFFYPLQIVFVLLAIYTVILTFSETRNSGKIIFIILAALWFWMGIAYHVVFFSAINKAAYLFGALFCMEGIFLLLYALNTKTTFSFNRNPYKTTAMLLLIYALIIYPVTGYLYGHRYPYAPTFGLPCPTTIFTFGILLFSKTRLPFYAILIPVIWTVIGFSAAALLHMYEDSALLTAGVLFVALNSVKLKQPATAVAKLRHLAVPSKRYKHTLYESNTKNNGYSN